jgi:uncharacterized protein YabN with tetrapyrrole methylase and pyrophosphatase domain
VSYQLDDLLYLMERLRDQQHGCPWDQPQTFETIVPHTLEEAYDVADAIDVRTPAGTFKLDSDQVKQRGEEIKAQKLQKRASRSGFDWAQPGPVIEKIAEELDEVREVLAGGDKETVANEIGDLLFSVFNLAPHLDLDAETAPAGSVVGRRQAIRALSPEGKPHTSYQAGCFLSARNSLRCFLISSRNRGVKPVSAYSGSPISSTATTSSPAL